MKRDLSGSPESKKSLSQPAEVEAEVEIKNKVFSHLTFNLNLNLLCEFITAQCQNRNFLKFILTLHAVFRSFYALNV